MTDKWFLHNTLILAQINILCQALLQNKPRQVDQHTMTGQLIIIPYLQVLVKKQWTACNVWIVNLSEVQDE